MSARYGVLKRDAGIALRGLYIINPEASGAPAVCIVWWQQLCRCFVVHPGCSWWGQARRANLLRTARRAEARHRPTCSMPVNPLPKRVPQMHCCAPQGVLEHITVNNFPIGRNVDEALRTLQACWAR